MNDERNQQHSSSPALLYQTKSLTFVIVTSVKLFLELDPVESGLLKALAPRGNARKGDNYLEDTAKNLLVASLKKEARLRRIGSDQIFATALVSAVEKRKARA